MRYVGRITDWNDDKGYGFVAPNGGGERAFVHVKSFVRATRRPVNGDLVSYELRCDAQQRWNATAIRYALASKPPRIAAPPDTRWLGSIRKVSAAVAIAVFAVGWWTSKLPTPVIGLYGFMSLMAIAMYARDKSAARDRTRRTPENTLHLVAVFGGWPGALVAQDLFRHKSSKASFQVVFWLTVVVNCGALTWILKGNGHLL
jgi:uncharacterized membrane protein YsdA (DUF1294 family)/cold shock CspA family protein